MAGRLAPRSQAFAAFVHVTDENGAAHVFAPGDEVPEWAAEKVTNPKALVRPDEADKSE